MFLDRVSVPIADVIAVNPVLSSNDEGVNNGQGQPEQQQQFKYFTVVYAKRGGHSANANKWRYHTVSLYNNDYRIVSVWIRTLQTAIGGMCVYASYECDELCVPSVCVCECVRIII